MATVREQAFPIGQRVEVIANEQGSYTALGDYSRFVEQLPHPLYGIVRGYENTSIAVDFGIELPANGTLTHPCARFILANTGYWFYANELRAVEQEPAQAPVPVPASAPEQAAVPVEAVKSKLPRLKVKLVNSRTNGWQVKLEPESIASRIAEIRHPGAMVKEFLPAQYRRHITRGNRWYDLNRWVNETINNGTIPADVWETTLFSWAMSIQIAHMQEETPGMEFYDEDLAKALVAGPPAIISIGSQLFTLRPSGMIDGAKALSLMRKRALDTIKQEKKVLLDSAKMEAGNIVRQAESRLSDIREEIARMAESRANQIPDWIRENEIPVMSRPSEHNHPWLVGIWLPLTIATVEILGRRTGAPAERKYTWHLNRGSTKMMLVWMPINFISGAYCAGGIRTRDYDLPHMTHGRTCMTLARQPAMVDNYRTYNQICEDLARAMQGINLGSLLSRGTERWHPEIGKQLPSVVNEWVNSHISTTDLIDRSMASGIVEETLLEREAAETFTMEGAAEMARRAAATPRE